MDNEHTRSFPSGAIRNSDKHKPDYEGYLSPIVLIRYGEYMRLHQIRPDGDIRDSDDWQKGIPQDVYIKSMFRHFISVWASHRGLDTDEDIQESLCGLLFNVMGYLFEVLKRDDNNGF